MARYPSSQPTDVELQMLNVLWQNGPSTARQIHDLIQNYKQTTYSTTVKMLSVMLDKGWVKRNEHLSPQVYAAAVSRELAGKRFVRDLIEKVYAGASMSLVLHALETTQASPDELAKVRRLLDEMEGKA
ncbi:MAG: BlaI/MecI/CopY family transcriptional regulator [Planctomycetales bacterium]|nr:BlaI/MecI/CopY family transcriptional regulator [Planctomycetales bacterium]